VPGDTEKQIDWKATARHGTPYVRDYEAETDRRTLLVVDHRASLATGSRAETQLEALREIALVIAGNARRLNDPLGLVTVGDDGITNHIGMASSVVNYGSVRRHLLELEATAADTTPVATASRSDGPPTADATAASSSTIGSAETHESPPSAETTTSPIARNATGRPVAPRQDRPAPRPCDDRSTTSRGPTTRLRGRYAPSIPIGRCTGNGSPRRRCTERSSGQ